mgnify:FL=1|jgi:hypothetical protein
MDIISDFVNSLKSSKRVITGVLTVIMMFAYEYFGLEEKGVSRESVNNIVITIVAVILGDSIRGVNPDKGQSPD